MNERFYLLPVSKQQAIINAGYKVFSRNSYKKSPMSEIARAAGISKALLFHYFKNKKELYLYLWENSGTVSMEYMKKAGCYAKDDLFEIMLAGLQAKVQIMKQYPDLSSFVMKAYYEKDAEVAMDIQQIAQKYTAYKTNVALLKLDASQFKEGIDLQLMYQDMYWAAEGYLFEKQQSDTLDVNEMEKDFIRLIAFWKKLYLRNEGTDERNTN